MFVSLVVSQQQCYLSHTDCLLTFERATIALLHVITPSSNLFNSLVILLDEHRPLGPGCHLKFCKRFVVVWYSRSWYSVGVETEGFLCFFLGFLGDMAKDYCNPFATLTFGGLRNPKKGFISLSKLHAFTKCSPDRLLYAAIFKRVLDTIRIKTNGIRP